MVLDALGEETDQIEPSTRETFSLTGREHRGPTRNGAVMSRHVAPEPGISLVSATKSRHTDTFRLGTA